MKNIPTHKTLSDLIDCYDHFLLDIWGVIHDGITVYPGVKQCLCELKAQGKKIYFISNSSTLTDELVAHLLSLGIDQSIYDHAITAGEVTRFYLANKTTHWAQKLGKKYYLVGHEKRTQLLANLDYQRVMDLVEADFILTAGLFPEKHVIEDYHNLLKTAAQYKLPLICANPDQMVVRQDNTIVICSGMIAKVYQQHYDGDIILLGKPGKEIYHFVLQNFTEQQKQRSAMIGDTLETDILGGQSVELDSFLITTGVTRFQIAQDYPELAQHHFEQHCHHKNIIPHGFLQRLML